MATSCKKLLSNGSDGRVKPRNKKPSVSAEGCKPSDSVESSDGNIDVSILSRPPNLYKQDGASMSNYYIKYIPGPDADLMRSRHPFAFLLLSLIVARINRKKEIFDGLRQGEAYIGDWDAIGASRQNYRTALTFLESAKIVINVETNRNRKKSTTGSTTAGTKVRLLSSTIFDVTFEDPNHRPNHCPTTDQPLPNHVPNIYTLITPHTYEIEHSTLMSALSAPTTQTTKLEKKEKKEIPTEAKDVALHLWKCIHEIFPKHKEPNIDKWASEIDKMQRCDKREWVDIRSVIKFTFEDNFWVKVIQSPEGFRRNFDKILAKMTPVNNQGSNKTQNSETANKIKALLNKTGEGRKFAIYQDSVANSLTGDSISKNLPTEKFEEILIKWFSLKKT